MWLFYLSLIFVVGGFVSILVGLIRMLRGSAPHNFLQNHLVARGMLAMVIGFVCFGIGLRLVLNQELSNSNEGPKFRITSVYPGQGKEVPVSAIARFQFSDAIPESAKQALAINRLEADGVKTAVSGWSQVIVGTSPDGQPNSTLIFRPLVACGQSTLRQTCFQAGRYEISLDPTKIINSANKPLESCHPAASCTWSFTVSDDFDQTEPTVTLDKEKTWPVGETASLDVNIDSEENVNLEVWLNRRLSDQKLLGTTVVGSGDSKITVSIKDLPAKSRNFINITALDGSGNVTEASTAVEVWAPHCLNQKQDGDEAKIDCGGNDCRSCF